MKLVTSLSLFLMMMMNLHSCGSRTIVQRVPVEYKHYLNKDSIRIERDTIRIIDSVIIDRTRDTVFIRQVREVEKRREVEVQKEKGDSIIPPNFKKIGLETMPPIIIDSPRSSFSKSILIYCIGGFFLILILIIAFKIKF